MSDTQQKRLILITHPVTPEARKKAKILCVTEEATLVDAKFKPIFKEDVIVAELDGQTGEPVKAARTTKKSAE